MKTVSKLFLFATAASLAGCATASNHSDYKPALQKAVDQRLLKRGVPDAGFCIEISNTGDFSYNTASRASYSCQGQTPKGYDFSVVKDMKHMTRETLDKFNKHGYIRIGKPYTCHYKYTQEFGGTVHKTAEMIPVAILKNNDDVRLVNMKTGNAFYGDQHIKELCVGRLKVTKIVSATKPHFNSKYSMKTAYVTADFGVIGIERLANAKMLKNKPKDYRSDFMTVSAIMGETSSGHWETLKITKMAVAHPVSPAS